MFRRTVGYCSLNKYEYNTIFLECNLQDLFHHIDFMTSYFGNDSGIQIGNLRIMVKVTSYMAKTENNYGYIVIGTAKY